MFRDCAMSPALTPRSAAFHGRSWTWISGVPASTEISGSRNVGSCFIFSTSASAYSVSLSMSGPEMYSRRRTAAAEADAPGDGRLSRNVDLIIVVMNISLRCRASGLSGRPAIGFVQRSAPGLYTRCRYSQPKPRPNPPGRACCVHREPFRARRGRSGPGSTVSPRVLSLAGREGLSGNSIHPRREGTPCRRT